MTDPRNDPRTSEPADRRPDSVGGMWGWIAGIAVLVLIAIILIAGWNSPTNTAVNTPAPAGTVGSATTPPPPAATTGAAPATHSMNPASTKPATQTPATKAPSAAPATPAPAKQ
ncbi:MAG: hypothetical protein P8Y71_21375 [Pseudolabrys sp.]